MSGPGHRGSRAWLTRVPVLGLALLVAGGGCYASAGYAVPADVVYDDAPPPAFIATAPVYYFDGRPAYWYHGHWFFREGPHWRRYRYEPAPLRHYRMGRGRPGPRPALRPRGAVRPQRMGPGRPLPRVAPQPRPAPAPPRGRRPAPRGRMDERPRRLQR